MESEMDAELRFHIEALAADLVRSGLSRQEALRRARLEFGAIERVKEEGREARGVSFADEMMQDLHTDSVSSRRVRASQLSPYSHWLWASAPRPRYSASSMRS